ncbi:M20 family metallopeptidase [Clostridium botulinum]|uniref:Peptidase M20 domain-containing protein 2 n=1 Tax=Clostridium botulinum TaxID=1491 RepID=A0A0M0A6Z0_CLOBO|nr:MULTISPECIES: amidohydrolase [unclassified Clostridium]AIY81010.1 putative amidohydrolase [Clostridium botulinum 202F]KAI3344199.1 M20 family peptidase [Clostridium botulinum]KFX55268.1 amidohydrolase [Clostridium botulinum]KFX56338.1 amidohydrolase [Clostridium botulinum]KON11926.1 amidohydrolase [Clostridium botulinum]
MKQEIISFLSTCDKELNDLSSYLYNNPEESYSETKSSKYICNLLNKHNFEVSDNFLDISNSFICKKGTGYPKICFISEYDAVKDYGHITGHNALSTISVGAALALGSVVNKIGGSVILIGCPGEYLGGTKAVMTRQGVFDDIDVVMLAHPDVLTSESGTSSSIIPLSIKYEGKDGLTFLNKNIYTALDAILLNLNILNSLQKGFPKDLEINPILSKGGYTPLLLPAEAEAKFYIRSKNCKTSEWADNKLRTIAKYVSELTNLEYSTSLYEPSNKELITNRTLNRLFSHNLKENSIIDIGKPRDIYAGLSLGDVSHKVPCIHPYICITDDPSIKYGTKDFAKATQSEFALKQCKNASLALAFTGMDLIQNETLLNEIKDDFFKNKNI